ncbi:30S ribosomal protein S15 [Candidatus Uhrbacteria bacterium CG10_big_fil_rev_8_21_14_0_10_48_11]|uniref:Small ribosomal subunit protein uS15 n=1 Tax=Candidatus Uhrbacteria bacterium CG10_big_fil_rev_8_21_14_0_10_48_11 TaxID=1975037 RepID=A0A2M8LDS9_9BACT|nr:MAG: 30S ribosomal protein S15 [Candidatus Uhrbacteria bacterium CG10_big_fil_rev_8_21_14_0_10_48_11]
MLEKKAKDRIIKKYRTHDSDTGSSQVQIAILTAEIKDLTEHLKTHRKDHSSRRGLLKKVGERRRLLRYLEHEDPKGFETLVKQLKLKIAKRYDQKTIEAAEAAHVAELEAAEEAENDAETDESDDE